MEPDVIIMQFHLILMIEKSSSPGGTLPLHPPWVPGLAHADNLWFREAWWGLSPDGHGPTAARHLPQQVQLVGGHQRGRRLRSRQEPWKGRPLDLDCVVRMPL